MFGKEIVVDDAGWGDLILGVVMGSLKLPDRKYMERRIPVSSFQPPDFARKKYLTDAVRIIKEVIKVMHADKETHFKVCSGYVLSEASEYLKAQGFTVEKIVVRGELQQRVERGYIKWCIEVGVPAKSLSQVGGRRFWILLDWVKEKPKVREGLVKTGWKSWSKKWRKTAFHL